MNRRLILVVLALAATAVAAPPFNGGFACFGPTVGIVDFSGMNSEFRTGGVRLKKELGSLQWGFGGGGYVIIDRVVIGGSGWGSSQTVASDLDGLNARVSVSGGEFDLGYQVYSLKRLLIAPMLGIGGGGYAIELQQLTGDVPNFGRLLQNPGRTGTVSFSGLTLSPQLMVTIPISFVGVQLRGGYCYAPTNPEWTLENGGKLLIGPAISKGMPFVTLNVAFGGFEGGTRRKGRK